jgi:hypothetical protein
LPPSIIRNAYYLFAPSIIELYNLYLELYASFAVNLTAIKLGSSEYIYERLLDESSNRRLRPYLVLGYIGPVVALKRVEGGIEVGTALPDTPYRILYDGISERDSVYIRFSIRFLKL